MRPQATIPSPFVRSRTLVIASVLFWLAAAPVLPQTPGTPATKPYATLNRQSVAYRGPVRTTESDSPGDAAVIGMILPLKGPQQSEGNALLAAAQLALEEERALGPLPDGRQLQLAVRDESGQWGQASAEILRLSEEDHALAVITSANGTSAHLAEQIANKISIPILTLASDPATTQANVPWLFRLGPSDSDQARAFCRRIYSDLGLKSVLLVGQMDHDGRAGGNEFEKAARESKADPPFRFGWADAPANLESFQETLLTKKPEAVVVWADAPAADKLLAAIHATRPQARVFLCNKAAQLETKSRANASSDPSSELIETLFAVDFPAGKPIPDHKKFEQLFLDRTGTQPGLAAVEAYEAVRLVSAAIRRAGANRILLRDYLANEGQFAGSQDRTPFDPAGNSLQSFALVRLQSENPVKP